MSIKEVIKETIEEPKLIYHSLDRHKNAYGIVGFKVWHLYGEFSYTVDEIEYSVTFSDTPSGCGPVQMYKYNSPVDTTKKEIKGFINMLKLIITAFYKTKYTMRIPVSISFIQGKYGKNFDYFSSCLQDIGFEVRCYKNIAHGMDTKDKQCFFYIDLTDKETVNLKLI